MTWQSFIILAERGGFEPPSAFQHYRFSKPTHSAALPPFRACGGGTVVRWVATATCGVWSGCAWQSARAQWEGMKYLGLFSGALNA